MIQTTLPTAPGLLFAAWMFDRVNTCRRSQRHKALLSCDYLLVPAVPPRTSSISVLTAVTPDTDAASCRASR